MGRTCAVISCRLNVGPFFHFPRPLNEKERDRLFEWIQASGNDSYLSLSLEKIAKKCIRFNHFDKSCFIYKRLSKFAIPTLNLPNPLGSYYEKLYEHFQVF